MPQQGNSRRRGPDDSGDIRRHHTFEESAHLRVGLVVRVEPVGIRVEFLLSSVKAVDDRGEMMNIPGRMDQAPKLNHRRSSLR